MLFDFELFHVISETPLIFETPATIENLRVQPQIPPSLSMMSYFQIWENFQDLRQLWGPFTIPGKMSLRDGKIP